MLKKSKHKSKSHKVSEAEVLQPHLSVIHTVIKILCDTTGAINTVILAGVGLNE